MQAMVNQILASAGVTTNFVLVLPEKKTVASAAGVCLSNLDFNLFGLISYKGTIAAGVITVDKRAIKPFLYDEIRFILAHECFHIIKNHLATRAVWAYIKRILQGERGEHVLEVALIEAAFKWFGKEHLPPNIETIRNQEYEADELAVRLTGNQTAAINCLTKLVKGELSKSSHLWELLGVNMPIMTMQQRIDELKRRTGIFFPSFPSTNY